MSVSSWYVKTWDNLNKLFSTARHEKPTGETNLYLFGSFAVELLAYCENELTREEYTEILKFIKHECEYCLEHTHD